MYVIAVNASRNAATSEINVPAFGDRVLRSLDGLHTVAARSGSFSDSLAPLDVRIYGASPFQG